MKYIKPMLMLTLIALGGCFVTAADKAHYQAIAMCGTPYEPYKTAWMFYDDCFASNPDFLIAIECGKRSRNADCQADGSCSQKGNSMVAFADSLAEKVKSGVLDSKQAYKKWDAYKNKEASQYHAAINAENAKAEECYQRAYPQFLQTETQRRSAIDQQLWQNINSNSPKQTHCSGTGTFMNCTTF